LFGSESSEAASETCSDEASGDETLEELFKT